MREDWEFQLTETQRQSRRVPLMRVIRYEATEALATDDCLPQPCAGARYGEALSINISSGGILLMMDWDPDMGRILRLDVPTPVQVANTPTLTQVRWKRRTPYSNATCLYFVGLKFIV